MDRVNREWYSRKTSVHAFAGDDLLEPTIVMLFVRYRELIVGKDVLDLGVGAGRTTLYLSALTDRYVGVDYSPAMVAHCKNRFPSTRLETMDARDLSAFGDETFDFVLFSYAGLGALDHESRLAVLREVARVLRRGGVFVFSAHNRDWNWARRAPRLSLSRNPITQLANVGRWILHLRNRARLKPLQVERDEYTLINDAAEGYALIHYYITEEQQRAQLERAGYSVIGVMDHLARDWSASRGAPPPPWLWYVAQR